MTFFTPIPGNNPFTHIKDATQFTTSHDMQSSSTASVPGGIGSHRSTEQNTAEVVTRDAGREQELKAVTYANILKRPLPQPEQKRNVMVFRRPTQASTPPQSATMDVTTQHAHSHDAETANNSPLSNPTSDSGTGQQRCQEELSASRRPLSVQTSFGDVDNAAVPLGSASLGHEDDLKYTSLMPLPEPASVQNLATPVSSERSYIFLFSSGSSAPAQQATPYPPFIAPQHQERPRYIQIGRHSSQTTSSSYLTYKLSRVHAGLIAWIYRSSSIAFGNHPCFIWGVDSSGMVEVSKATTRHGGGIEKLDQAFTKRRALKRREQENILIDDGETPTYYNLRMLQLEVGTLQKRSYVDLSCTERVQMGDLWFLYEMPRVRAEDVEWARRHHRRIFPGGSERDKV